MKIAQSPRSGLGKLMRCQRGKLFRVASGNRVSGGEDKLKMRLYSLGDGVVYTFVIFEKGGTQRRHPGAIFC